MLKLLPLLLFVLIGCSGSDSGTLSQSSMAQLKEGMTLEQVEAVIGPNTTQVIDMGGMAGYQWLAGKGDSTRSISVTFKNDKLETKVGTSLPK